MCCPPLFPLYLARPQQLPVPSVFIRLHDRAGAEDVLTSCSLAAVESCGDGADEDVKGGVLWVAGRVKDAYECCEDGGLAR